VNYSFHPFPGAIKVQECYSSTGYLYMSQYAYDAWLESIGQKAPKPQEIIETRPGRCECGSEAAGSSRHSTWCPAFEK
jgi:hypothetical protein